MLTASGYLPVSIVRFTVRIRDQLSSVRLCVYQAQGSSSNEDLYAISHGCTSSLTSDTESPPIQPLTFPGVSRARFVLVVTGVTALHFTEGHYDLRIDTF